nr:HXXEE domain-containing protein [Rhodococcus sp. HNM0569]
MFATWLLHDAEEAATMPHTSRRVAQLLAHSRVRPLRALAPHVRMDATDARVSIALMAPVVAVAAARGARTDGRDRFFQAVLAGLHGHVFTHIASSVVLRGYSTGVVSAVVLVWPYSVWARARLRREGVLDEGSAPYVTGVALLVPAALGVQAAARLVRHPRQRST